MCYPSVCFFFLCGHLGPPSGENAVFVFFLGGHFATHRRKCRVCFVFFSCVDICPPPAAKMPWGSKMPCLFFFSCVGICPPGGQSAVGFRVIHNLHIPDDSFLNSTIYYRIACGESLIYLLLTRLKLLSLVQSHM